MRQCLRAGVGNKRAATSRRTRSKPVMITAIGWSQAAGGTFNSHVGRHATDSQSSRRSLRQKGQGPRKRQCLAIAERHLRLGDCVLKHFPTAFSTFSVLMVLAVCGAALAADVQGSLPAGFQIAPKHLTVVILPNGKKSQPMDTSPNRVGAVRGNEQIELAWENKPVDFEPFPSDLVQGLLKYNAKSIESVSRGTVCGGSPAWVIDYDTRAGWHNHLVWANIGTKAYSIVYTRTPRQPVSSDVMKYIASFCGGLPAAQGPTITDVVNPAQTFKGATPVASNPPGAAPSPTP